MRTQHARPMGCGGCRRTWLDSTWRPSIWLGSSRARGLGRPSGRLLMNSWPVVPRFSEPLWCVPRWHGAGTQLCLLHTSSGVSMTRPSLPALQNAQHPAFTGHSACCSCLTSSTAAAAHQELAAQEAPRCTCISGHGGSCGEVREWGEHERGAQDMVGLQKWMY